MPNKYIKFKQSRTSTSRNKDVPSRVGESGKGVKMSLSNKRKRNYVIAGAAAFTTAFVVAYVAGAEFLRPDASKAATNVSASISSGSYYINVTSLGEVNIDVDATTAGGKGEGSDIVTVNTNTSGYKLYIGTTNNTNSMYMNGDETSTYSLNPTSSGNLDVNSWGYKLAGENDFKAVPIKGGERLLVNQTGLTANQNNEKSHSVVYGAKADMTLPAGRYSRTVTYSAVADASAVTNLASVSPSEFYRKPSGNITLTIATPMMTNMDYGTWTVRVGSQNCTNVVVDESKETLSMTCEIPYTTTAGTYTVTATSTKYGSYTASNAVKVKKYDIFAINNMQEMTDFVCSETTKPKDKTITAFDNDGSKSGNDNFIPQTTLTDTRGTKRTYLVRKLADNNCWMAQNLELDILGTGQAYATAKTSDTIAGNDAANDNGKSYFGTQVTSGVKFTKDDTDLNTMNEWTPSSVSVPTYATQTHTIDSANPEYGWKNDGSDGLRSYSYAGSNSNWAYAVKTGGGGGSSYTFEDSASGERYERRGNLYNWTAATLGSGLSLTTDGQVAQNSICPKGWKLPDNSGSKSFRNLLTTAYGLTANGDSVSDYNALNDLPLSFGRTGYYGRSYGYINGRTSYGYWWSSTAGSSAHGHNLNSWPGLVHAQYNLYRGNGFAVRCVAR